MSIIVNSKERAGSYMETTLQLRMETLADFQALRGLAKRLTAARLVGVMPGSTLQADIDLLEAWAAATATALDTIAIDRGYPAG